MYINDQNIGNALHLSMQIILQNSTHIKWQTSKFKGK